MATTDEPYWLQDANKGNAQSNNPLSQGTNNNGNNGPIYKPDNVNNKVESNTSEDQKKSSNAKIAMTIFCFIVNVGLMFLYGYTAYLALIKIDGRVNASEAGQGFVGAYMLIFGFVLFVFEVAQIFPCECFDNYVKRTFGFLYGPLGKSGYLVFIGMMAFGLDYPKTESILSGSLVIGWALLQGILYVAFPHLFSVKEKYDPTKDKK